MILTTGAEETGRELLGQQVEPTDRGREWKLGWKCSSGGTEPAADGEGGEANQQTEEG